MSTDLLGSPGSTATTSTAMPVARRGSRRRRTACGSWTLSSVMITACETLPSAASVGPTSARLPVPISMS